MGLLDYFSGDAKLERRRASCHKKLTNMYYQKADRLAAAHAAAEMAAEGDEASVVVLLNRFEHLAPSTTIDREEKEYVHDLLVGLGDRAIAPVKRYIRTTGAPVYWAIQVLDAVTGTEATGAFVAELLGEMDNGYWREPEKKIGVVQMAAEYSAPAMGEALLPFLEDHTEQVRFNAVDSLLRVAGDDARPALLARMLNREEESLRILNRIADAWVERQWTAGDDVDAFAARLPAAYVLADGLVRRR